MGKQGKSIRFEFKGKPYVLEFNRASVKALERMGLDPEALINQPLTQLEMLFRGAFTFHHNKISQKEVDEIFKHMGDKEELVAKLIEMYNEPLATLMDEPENAEERVDWDADW